MTILLVDDSEINRVVTSRLLEMKGHSVTVAGDGDEALNRIAESPPDLVLMDVQMPVMDGVEAIRRIRTDPAFVDLPIYALTAYSDPMEIDRCNAAGANDVLLKPLDVRVLEEKINHVHPRGAGS